MKHKYCPPGFICVKNLTTIFAIIIVLIIAYFVYVNFKGMNVNVHNSPNIYIQKDTEESFGYGSGYGTGYGPNIPYNNFPADVLMNPYVPPLRDERYLVPSVFTPPFFGGGMPPFNVNTNRNIINTQYRQVGLLTPMNQKSVGRILPLMGRPLNLGRDSWNYYTMSDQRNSVKLPVVSKKKSCTNEYGCDKLYNGDMVFVKGYNQAFRVTDYDNDSIQYIPSIF